MLENLKAFYHRGRRLLAKAWFQINSQLTVVGVTGSFGKTTAVRAIAEVLSSRFSVNRTDLNLDTNFNLPITILKTKIWNQVLVLEYGIDHLGEMETHLALAKPHIAVLTGITPVHAESGLLGSLENIITEKRRLVEALPADGLAIFNYDDKEVQKIGQEFKGEKIFYGLNRKADIWAEKVKVTPEGTEFLVHDRKEIKFRTGLLGYPAVSACLVAYIVGRRLGVSAEKMVEKLAGLRPLKGRLSVEPGPLGTVLVNDAKRSNPASALAGLKTLSEFPGRRIAVLGEMGELGDWEEEMHRQVGKEAAGLKIDFIVGVGPLTEFILAEARKAGMKESQLFWAGDVLAAAEVLQKILKPKDFLYLKASLLRHLERVVLLLEGKKVACSETVCHHYGPCTTCARLVK